MKMPDQMPAHRHLDGGHLLQCFLDLVLADVVQARGIRGFSRLRTMSLGDCDDRDLLSVSAPRDSRIDSGSHVGYTLSQAGKSHSGQI